MSTENSPEDKSLDAPARRPRRMLLWIGAAVAAVLVVGASIAIPMYITAQEEAAAAQEAAEAEKAAIAAEKKRLATFTVALFACDLSTSSDGIELLDGGEAIKITGVGKSWFSGLQTKDLYCFLDELDAPAALEAKIGTTRALDGKQSDSWSTFLIEWSYHPNSGANVLVEHAR